MAYRLEINITSDRPLPYRRIVKTLMKMLKDEKKNDITIYYHYLIEGCEEVGG